MISATPYTTPSTPTQYYLHPTPYCQHPALEHQHPDTATPHTTTPIHSTEISAPTPYLQTACTILPNRLHIPTTLHHTTSPCHISNNAHPITSTTHPTTSTPQPQHATGTHTVLLTFPHHPTSSPQPPATLWARSEKFNPCRQSFRVFLLSQDDSFAEEAERAKGPLNPQATGVALGCKCASPCCLRLCACPLSVRVPLLEAHGSHGMEDGRLKPERTVPLTERRLRGIPTQTCH